MNEISSVSGESSPLNTHARIPISVHGSGRGRIRLALPRFLWLFDASSFKLWGNGGPMTNRCLAWLAGCLPILLASAISGEPGGATQDVPSARAVLDQY